MKISQYQWDALIDITRDSYEEVLLSSDFNTFVIKHYDGTLATFRYDGTYATYDNPGIMDFLIQSAKDTGEWFNEG